MKKLVTASVSVFCEEDEVPEVLEALGRHMTDIARGLLTDHEVNMSCFIDGRVVVDDEDGDE